MKKNDYNQFLNNMSLVTIFFMIYLCMMYLFNFFTQ